MDAPRHAKLLLDTLAHQVELVVGVPALDHLAFRGEAEDADAVDLHLLSCGSDPPELAFVGAANLPAGHHLVPFGDLLLYGGMEVGESVVKLAHEPLDVFGAALEDRPVWLVGEVAIEDLVRKLQVPLVGDLLDVAPEGSLVLFGRHASLLLRNPFLPAGR